MKNLLEDKTCIITGGYGSIALASAKLFLAEDARGVVLVGRDKAKLEAARESLISDRVEICQADVSEARDVDRYISAATARWGQFDVLLSTACGFGLIAPLADYDDEDFLRTLRIHVYGAYLACKTAPPHMRDLGSIIITSSGAGLRGGAGCENNMAYTTAKHAQTGVVRAAARAWAHRGIRVNSLNPGPIDNSFQDEVERELSLVRGLDVTREINKAIPLGRHAHPDEIAQVALLLASPMSSFVTGHIYPVDGGFVS